MVKKLPANAGNVGSISGLRRSLGGEKDNLLSGKIPWREKPGGLQLIESGELDRTGRLNITHTTFY